MTFFFILESPETHFDLVTSKIMETKSETKKTRCLRDSLLVASCDTQEGSRRRSGGGGDQEEEGMMMMIIPNSCLRKGGKERGEYERI